MGDNNFKDLDSSDIIVGGKSSNINNIIRNQRMSPNMSPNLNGSNNSIGINNNNSNSNNNNNSVNNLNSNSNNNNNNNNLNSNNNCNSNSQNNTPNSIRNNNNNNNININQTNNNLINSENKNIKHNNNNNNNAIINSSSNSSLSDSNDLLPPPPSSSYSNINNHQKQTTHFEMHFDNYLIHDRACSSYADRVLFSNKYYYSYVFMIIINLILIIWLITNLIKKNTSVPSHWAFIVLDILVNVTLSVEIILQIISQKKKYFQTWANIFDLFVLVISVGGLFLYFHSSSESFESVVIIFVTAIRYFFQFLRLIALINRQKLKKSTFNSRVDFTELREADIDFDIDSNDDF